MLIKFSSLTLLAALLTLSLFLTPTVLASPSFAGPGNDNFANALNITGSSGSVGGNNEGATKEGWEGSHAGNWGGASAWYRWIAPANGGVVFDTAGSNLDTLLAVYMWPNRRGPLVEVGSNDDTSSGVTISRVKFNAKAGTEYFVAVDGYNGETGRLTLAWRLDQNAPLTVDLAVTDLYPDNMPRGRVFTRITNNGPAILANLGVKLECRALLRPRPGVRAPGDPMYVEKTVSVTLRPGQTGIFDTGIPIDTSDFSYGVTCSVSGTFSDPRPSNNSYSENIP